MSSTIKFQRSHQRQQGATLIITLVVLFVITFLAISSTSSNRIQAIMARNSQFELEAWNSSYSEITAQINAINAVPVADGIPDYITRQPERGDFDFDIATRSDLVAINSTIDAGIRSVIIDCFDNGSGNSAGSIRTNHLILASLTNLTTPPNADNDRDLIGIDSDQRQRITVNFTGASTGSCTSEEEVSDDVSIPAAP